MNAAIRIDKAVDGLEAEPVYRIPTDRITESPTNPRKRFDEKYIGELAADFQGRVDRGERHVILQPVLVRPVAGGDFELVFGACRFRAATRVGLAEMPATVRNMTDEEVLEAQLVENANRKDVHPLEEADGFKAWHEKYKKSVDEIAAKVGRTPGYVYARLKLCALCKEARKAFLADELPLSVALGIARIPDPKLQAEATAEILDRRDHFDGQFGTVNASEALDFLRRDFMLELGRAPFPITNATLLPKAGACTTCPKRTGNQPELFADVKSKDMCTDPVCHKAKAEAHWEQRAALAEQAGHRILTPKEAKDVFAWGGDLAWNAPYVEVTQKVDQDPRKRTWAKLLGKNLPELVLGRDDRGGIHELIPRKAAIAAAAAAGVEIEDTRGAGGVAAGSADSYKQEQERQREAFALRRGVATEALGAIAAAAETAEPDHAFWLTLALGMIGASWHDVVVDVTKRRGIFEVKKRAEDLLRAHVKTLEAPALRGLVVELLATRGAYQTYSSGYGENLKTAAKAYGIDLAKLEAKAKAALKVKKDEKRAKERARAKRTGSAAKAANTKKGAK